MQITTGNCFSGTPYISFRRDCTDAADALDKLAEQLSRVSRKAVEAECPDAIGGKLFGCEYAGDRLTEILVHLKY